MSKANQKQSSKEEVIGSLKPSKVLFPVSIRADLLAVCI